jgi:DNA-binding NarL/FixJ family response regulator
LERARIAFAQRAWVDAFQTYSDIEQGFSLEADDLERLALAAYLIGKDEDYLKTLERAYRAHRDVGERLRAVRCAFWLGFRLLARGELGRATGWLSRAERLLERDAAECAERGYLLLPTVEQSLASGDHEVAFDGASAAASIGERCGDPDLLACARHQQGRIRLLQGMVERGLSLLDETMLTVLAGELSPLVTGLLYCSVIGACQSVRAFDRASEWTIALTEWCDEQPDMVAFTGACRVHRAEIMQLQGTWPAAIEEARRACTRTLGNDRRAAAAALYLQAEIHRLKGGFAAAEEFYGRASELGLEPQPGLALLRLAQGSSVAAVTAIRRVAGTTTDRLKRLDCLPAYVEILLAVGDVQDARDACHELQEISAHFTTDVSDAIAAQARGAVALAENDAHGALAALRRALEVWQQIEAPYEAARVRVLIGLACRALGDEDGTSLELVAARSAFARLGAKPDLNRTETLMRSTSHSQIDGLTPREIQVLRLVAAGETNKSIARKLGLSVRTIERHLSNIFTKLDLSTRSGATAWAYEHRLL